MGKKVWTVFGFWALGLVLLIATFIVIRWMISFASWSTLDSSWAQAIGSVVAIGVAIWLASSQARQNASNERARAIVIAAKLAPKLDHAQAHLSSLIANLVFGQQNNLLVAARIRTQGFLMGTPLSVETEDLVTLVGLGGNLATQLASTLSEIEYLHSIIKAYIESGENGDKPLSTHYIGIWSKLAQEADFPLKALLLEFKGIARINRLDRSIEGIYETDDLG